MLQIPLRHFSKNVPGQLIQRSTCYLDSNWIDIHSDKARCEIISRAASTNEIGTDAASHRNEECAATTCWVANSL
jgi:hypothetical protein